MLVTGINLDPGGLTWIHMPETLDPWVQGSSPWGRTGNSDPRRGPGHQLAVEDETAADPSERLDAQDRPGDGVTPPGPDGDAARKARVGENYGSSTLAAEHGDARESRTPGRRGSVELGRLASRCTS